MIESGQLIKELSDQQSELGKLAKAESTSHDVGAYDYNGSLTGEGLDNSGSEHGGKTLITTLIFP